MTQIVQPRAPRPGRTARAVRGGGAGRSVLRGLALTAVLGALLPSAAGAASNLTIRIGSTLSPASATVAPGTRVVWVNRDTERHRVRTTSAPVRIDSGNLEPGETWSVVLTATGTYSYLDDRDREDAAYHGTVVVSSSSVATGGGSGGGEPPGDGGGAASAGATGTKPPASASVTIGDNVFRPATVTIATGGTVNFRNADDRPHSATGSGSFDTGILASGGSAAERFATAGTFPFLCVIHPDMRGTVRVVAPGTSSAPAPAAPRPSSSPSPTQPPAPAPVQPAPGSASGGSGSVEVDIADASFGPASVAEPGEAADAPSAALRDDRSAPVRALGAILVTLLAVAGFGRVLRGVARP